MNLAEKVVSFIPDAVLTNVFKLIAQKLIGNISDDQKQAAWDSFLEFWKLTVEAGAEGAARGTVEGMKDKNV